MKYGKDAELFQIFKPGSRIAMAVCVFKDLLIYLLERQR